SLQYRVRKTNVLLEVQKYVKVLVDVRRLPGINHDCRVRSFYNRRTFDADADGQRSNVVYRGPFEAVVKIDVATSHWQLRSVAPRRRSARQSTRGGWSSRHDMESNYFSGDFLASAADTKRLLVKPNKTLRKNLTDVFTVFSGYWHPDLVHLVSEPHIHEPEVRGSVGPQPHFNPILSERCLQFIEG